MVAEVGAVVVDDESAPRHFVVILLKRRHPEVEPLGTAADVPTCVDLDVVYPLNCSSAPTTQEQERLRPVARLGSESPVITFNSSANSVEVRRNSSLPNWPMVRGWKWNCR